MKKITSILLGAAFAASLNASVGIPAENPTPQKSVIDAVQQTALMGSQPQPPPQPKFEPKAQPARPKKSNKFEQVQSVAPVGEVAIQGALPAGNTGGVVSGNQGVASAENPNFNVSLSSDGAKSGIVVTVKDSSSAMSKEEYFKELRQTISSLFGENTDITKSLFATLAALETVAEDSNSMRPQLNLSIEKTNPYSCTATFGVGNVYYRADTQTTVSPEGTTQTQGTVVKGGTSITVGPYGGVSSNVQEYKVDIKGDSSGVFSGNVGDTVVVNTSGSSGGNANPIVDLDDDTQNDKVPDNTVVTSKSN